MSNQNSTLRIRSAVDNALTPETHWVPFSDDDSLVRGSIELPVLAGGQQSGQNETRPKKIQKVQTTAKNTLAGNTSNSGTFSAQTASNTLAISTGREPKTTKRNRNDTVEDLSVAQTTTANPSATTLNSTLDWTGKRLRSGNSDALTTQTSSIPPTVREQPKKIPDLEDSIAALVTSSTPSGTSLPLEEGLEDTKKSLVALLEGIRVRKSQLSSNQTNKK